MLIAHVPTGKIWILPTIHKQPLKKTYFSMYRWYNYGLYSNIWQQKRISKLWVNNYIPQCSMGCNYSLMPQYLQKDPCVDGFELKSILVPNVVRQWLLEIYHKKPFIDNSTTKAQSLNLIELVTEWTPCEAMAWWGPWEIELWRARG